MLNKCICMKKHKTLKFSREGLHSWNVIPLYRIGGFMEGHHYIRIGEFLTYLIQYFSKNSPEA